MDLRLLGCWRHVPLAALTTATMPVGAAGFALAATSGAALLATNATEYVDNPFLMIKFPAIGLGLINVLVLMRSRAWRARAVRELSRAEDRQLALMGAVSLGCWLTAIAAGRLIGYW